MISTREGLQPLAEGISLLGPLVDQIAGCSDSDLMDVYDHEASVQPRLASIETLNTTFLGLGSVEKRPHTAARDRSLFDI